MKQVFLPGKPTVELVRRSGIEVLRHWERIVHPLPTQSGYRLLIEATLTNTAESSFVAVDDMSIGPCENVASGQLNFVSIQIIYYKKSPSLSLNTLKHF